MTPQPIYRVTVNLAAPQCSTVVPVQTAVSLPMPPASLAAFLGAVPVVRYPTSEKQPKAISTASREAAALSYVASNPGCSTAAATAALGITEEQWREAIRKLRNRGLVEVTKIPKAKTGGIIGIYSVTPKGAKEAQE